MFGSEKQRKAALYLTALFCSITADKRLFIQSLLTLTVAALRRPQLNLKYFTENYRFTHCY